MDSSINHFAEIAAKFESRNFNSPPQKTRPLSRSAALGLLSAWFSGASSAVGEIPHLVVRVAKLGEIVNKFYKL